MDAFTAALQRLANAGALREYIATRPVALSNLYLARFLPPVRSTLAEIQTGNFRIITEPAALTAVDSPYAKVGEVQSTAFTGRTFKLTAEVKLSEANQDAMHARANAELIRAATSGTVANLQPIYENFIARLNEDGVQLALDYGEEVFRAIALSTGKVQVKDTNTGNGVSLDFEVPAEHKVSRTGNDAYDKPGSKFWDDVQTAREKLGVEPIAITNPTTWNAILNNPAHGIIATAPVQLAPKVWSYTIGQAAKLADGTFNLGQRTLDYRRTATIIVYGSAVDKPGASYFWPTGRLTFMRESSRRVELIDGQVVRGALGVTHIGPNTEAGQASTRFNKVYVPEGNEFEVIAKGSVDLMPHVEEARNLFLAKTELGAA